MRLLGHREGTEKEKDELQQLNDSRDNELKLSDQAKICMPNSADSP